MSSSGYESLEHMTLKSMKSTQMHYMLFVFLTNTTLASQVMNPTLDSLPSYLFFNDDYFFLANFLLPLSPWVGTRFDGETVTHYSCICTENIRRGQKNKSTFLIGRLFVFFFFGKCGICFCHLLWRETYSDLF